MLTGIGLPKTGPAMPLDLAGFPGRPLQGSEGLVAGGGLLLSAVLGSSLGRMTAATELGWLPFLVLLAAVLPMFPYIVALLGLRLRTGPFARDTVALPLAPEERWRILGLGPIPWFGIGPLVLVFGASFVLSAAAASGGEVARFAVAVFLGLCGAVVLESMIVIGLLLPVRVLALAVPAGTVFLFVLPMAFYLLALTGKLAGLVQDRERLFPVIAWAEDLYRMPWFSLVVAVCLYVIIRQFRTVLIEFRLTSERMARENEYLTGDSFLAVMGRMVSARSSGDAAPVDMWRRLLGRKEVSLSEPAYDVLGTRGEFIHAQIELLTFQRMSRNVIFQMTWRPVLALLPAVLILVFIGLTQGWNAAGGAAVYVLPLLGGLSVGGAVATAFLSGDLYGGRIGGLQSAMSGRGDPRLMPWAWMPGVADRLYRPLAGYVIRIARYAVPSGTALASLLAVAVMTASGSDSAWLLAAAATFGALGALLAMFSFMLRTPLRTMFFYRFSDRDEGVSAVFRSFTIMVTVLLFILLLAAIGLAAVYGMAVFFGSGLIGVIILLYLLVPLLLLVAAGVLNLYVAVERSRYRAGQRDIEGRPPFWGLLSGSAAIRSARR
ncbi:MAG: hypothetical protein KIT79_04905 [Deltaproteobacteria bacterium]|nr:hypothetical protein [Deltaproteobacteria bacterium]